MSTAKKPSKPAAKKPAAKPAAKKPAAKPIAKKPAAKPAAKKAAAKPVAKPVTKKPVAKKASEPAKPVKKAVIPPPDNPEMRRLNGKLLKPGKKKVKEKVQAPLRMNKQTAKAPKASTPSNEFFNDEKDFAFAFAESMKAAAAARDAADNAASIRLSRRPTTRKPGTDTMRFSESDLASFRKTLLALRDTVEGKTRVMKENALEQTIDRAGEDEDGSDSFMRLQNLGQANEQNKVLQKIDDALNRIADGTYGICAICGQLIRKQRLQHLPFAHTCMECQSAMEGK